MTDGVIDGGPTAIAPSPLADAREFARSRRFIPALTPCGLCKEPIVAGGALWAYHTTCRHCRVAFHVPCLCDWQSADPRVLPLPCTYKTVREADKACPSCGASMAERSAQAREALIVYQQHLHSRSQWPFCTAKAEPREVALQGCVAQLFAEPDPFFW
jgi:hypothetical protein